jgi:rod shape-determining protein MreD
MIWPVMLILALFSAVLQMVVPPLAVLGSAKLPFLVCLVLYYALAHDSMAMLFSCLVTGILQDSLSPLPMGTSVLCFCAVGLPAGWFRRLVNADSPEVAAAFGFAGCTVATVVSYLLLRHSGLLAVPFWNAMWKSLCTGFLGAVMAPVVFKLVGVLDRLLGNMRIKREVHGFD